MGHMRIQYVKLLLPFSHNGLTEFIDNYYLHNLLCSMGNFVKLYSKQNFMVKAVDSQSRVLVFKTTGWLQVDLASHPFEVDKMSTRNFWELKGKNCLLEVVLALRQLNHIHKAGP